jgi:hypothetical protein
MEIFGANILDGILVAWTGLQNLFNLICAIRIGVQ